MELRDFIVTPIVIIIVYVVAYFIRDRVTDEINRKYFFSALTLKIFAAIALGMLYQFYYSGGDTFNFHTKGSRIIWEAFMDSPAVGWKLLTANKAYSQGIYSYASRIPFFHDTSSFFVIRVAALFDLITFSSYSATAVLFSVVSFCGAWVLFLTFYRQSPTLHGWIATATLFIPSVLFWGSGLLKDTLTLAAIGFLTYTAHRLFIQKNRSVGSVIWLAISVWIIYSIKKYILLCFLPALLLWIYIGQLARIRSVMVRILITPLVLFMVVLSGYYAVDLVGRDDSRYSMDRIATTAQITAYDIGFYTGKDAGSTYSLGELDGTFGNMITKTPQAINVSLFRPYLWEVRNPLMLLSAVEGLLLLMFTIYVISKKRLLIFRAMGDPNVLFCLVFSITFAFAVGVSTFNFGTLSRYKIPLLPFYALALVFILYYENKDRKVEVLDNTEY
ncbi:MAG: hypothetical protein KF845_14685 [Cyclobacteriaceae bacterium]|nr:hypothetical protein [Cyclobacteriaceae bacterium]